MSWSDIPPIVWLFMPIIVGLIFLALSAVVEYIWKD